MHGLDTIRRMNGDLPPLSDDARRAHASAKARNRLAFFAQQRQKREAQFGLESGVFSRENASVSQDTVAPSCAVAA